MANQKLKPFMEQEFVVSNNKEFKEVIPDIPKVASHATHPFKHPNNHKTLLDYIDKRMVQASSARDARTPRYAEIDKTVAAWAKLTVSDKERKKLQDSEGRPLPTDFNVPIAAMHLDDTLTYFTGIFAPISGMFSLSGDLKQQTSGLAIIKIMEEHATHTKQFMAISKACWAILKYNLGGIYTHWDAESGKQFGQNVTTGKLESREKIVWRGNRVDPMCMYNSFWDPHVDPENVADHGEFAGFAEMVSPFTIKRDSRKGLYGNTEKYFKADGYDKVDGNQDYKYYKFPPAESGIMPDTMQRADGETDWIKWSGASTASTEGTGIELLHLYMWINPYRFSLILRTAENKINRNIDEIWRITLSEGKHIIQTTHMNNIHEKLPFNFSSPNADEMGHYQKSDAEAIRPFQTFASFIYNIHVAALRKNVWGTVVYDQSKVDLSQIPEGESAARVPVKSAAQGQDVRTFVQELHQNRDTGRLMEDVQNTLEMVNMLFPKQADPNQVAGMDRAIKSQVAFVRQGGNRRLFKKGRIIDAQMLSGSRVMSYFNILQFHKEPVKVADEDGNEKSITIENLREVGIEFILGHGLKTLDREATVENLKEIIFMILQNQAATTEFDIPNLINYLSSNMDIEADLNQFRAKPAQSPTGGGPDANSGTTGVDGTAGAAIPQGSTA